MDLYLTNGLMGDPRVIENFESVVWTERYVGASDFVLTLKDDRMFEGDLRMYQYITSSYSQRVMQVETIDRPRPEDGDGVITVKGRSMEAFFEHRHNKAYDTDEIVSSGTVANIMEYMVDRYCIKNTSVNAGIPNLYIRKNSVGGTSQTVVVKRDTIYNILNSLSDIEDLGWRIIRDDDRKLVFEVYKGDDLTDPTKTYYREMSEDMGNLTDVSHVRSVANFKNHARVLGKRTAVDVYAPG